MPLIPRRFSRLQVVAIITFMLVIFYTFRKDINAYFDQINIYTTAHPELGENFLIMLLVFAFGGMAIMGCWMFYEFKIEPKRYQKRMAIVWRERLEENRTQMNALDYTMESCAMLFQNVADEKNRIYLLGYGKK